MPIDLRDLVRNPETTPFSRLKYLVRQSEEDVTRFMNELFNLAALAKEEDDWRPVEQFLNRWEEILTDRLELPLAFDTAPWAPFTKSLSQARIAVLTTGGIHTCDQEPFNVDGDHSYREIPLDTPLEDFRVAHTHYDTVGVAEDVDAVFAIHRLQELAAEGVVGEAQSPTYSFMGYIRDVAGLIEVTAPEVAQRLKDEEVDGAVIGTT
ncbi:MAG: glycine/sarcosine/betaine reductase selenoprotein B family protein [Chloroflexi bacterium]|nr:glycine/sarcosine/betaine reductase selenoprotein B family protein [Chloroflexota bacterium]